MPSALQWLAFLAAALVFIQVPGPSLLFTIGRALTVGRTEALLSVVGNGLGLMVQVLAVALGLGALVATSAEAYTAVRLLGAAYVLWLGVQAVRHRADARLAMLAQTSGALPPPRRGHAVKIGLVVGVTNPKTIVFFSAFLPQFVNVEASSTWVQLLVLGAAFAVLAVVSDSVWALVAGRARDWFGSRPERLDHLAGAGGTMMVTLGAIMLVQG